MVYLLYMYFLSHFVLQIEGRPPSQPQRRNGRRRRKKRDVEGGEDTGETKTQFGDQNEAGSPLRLSRKLPAVALDTHGHQLKDGGLAGSMRTEEHPRKNGEDTRVRGEGLSTEGEENSSMEMEDHQLSSRTTSGHQCNSKLNLRPQEDFDITSQQFMKSPFEERSRCPGNRTSTVYQGHQHQTYTTTTASSDIIVSTTNKVLTSTKTTSMTTPTSSTVYHPHFRKENTRDKTVDGSNKGIEMTEITSSVTHFMESSSRLHNQMEDMVHTAHGHQDYQKNTQCSTFNRIDLYPPHQNSDLQQQDFDPHLPHQDETSKANRLQDHSIPHGLSIQRTSDRDRSLDREPQHLYRQRTRDPSLHSLDLYPMNSLGASTSNMVTMSTTTKTFPSDQQILHHLSSYHPQHHRQLYHPDEDDRKLPLMAMSTPTSIHGTPKDLQPQHPTLFKMKPTQQISEIMDRLFLPQYGADIQISDIQKMEADQNHKTDYLEQMRIPFDLAMCSRGNRIRTPQHYSLMNLNQSLQDLRPGNKLIGSHIGYKFPRSGYLSRSVTRIASQPRIGDYVSCDQLLTSIRRQDIEDELIAICQRGKRGDDDDDDCDSFSYDDEECNNDDDVEQLQVEKWYDSRYSSAEELTKREFVRSESRKIIRQLLQDRLRLTELEHTLTDEETRRVIDEHTRSYEDEYVRRIDKDRIIDEQIQRLDDDLRKADILHRFQGLGAVDLPSNQFLDQDKSRIIKGLTKHDDLVGVSETRGRDRVRRYSRRGVSSVSPRRYPSATRDHRTVRLIITS